MNKWLSFLVVLFLVLCGCGRDIRDHEDNGFRERKSALVKALGDLRGVTSTALEKWRPRAEERAKSQPVCRKIFFLTSYACKETMPVALSFKQSLGQRNCPKDCPHLQQGKAADDIMKTCGTIIRQADTIEHLEKTFEDIGEKFPDVKVTAAQRELIDDLNRQLADALKLLADSEKRK